VVSVLFDYILKPDFLGMFPGGTINLNPALLPYNRGQYPNVWSIVEGTPAGATIILATPQQNPVRTFSPGNVPFRDGGAGTAFASESVPVDPGPDRVL